jgi:streptogramin lyase
MRGVAVIALGVLIAACASQVPVASAPPPDAGSAPSTPASPSPDPDAEFDARLIAELSLPGGPDLPTEAFGSLWVLAPDGDVPAVHRVDPTTNTLVTTIDVPMNRCQGLGVSPEAVWVCSTNGLARIDPATNAVVATVGFPTAGVFSPLPYGDGSVWVFSSQEDVRDTIVRVDPATDTVTATIPLGHIGGTMAYGKDALWVSSPDDDMILRVDPTTDSVEEWATGLDGVSFLAIDDETGIWASLHGEEFPETEPGDPTMVRIDPVDGSEIARIDIGGQIGMSGSISPSADGIWVRAAIPFLVRIDPVTNEVVDRIDANKAGGMVVTAFGSVWATSWDLGGLWRLRPTP